MNIQDFSKQLLEEALTTGIITLANGDKRELKATEILSVAKYIVSNNLTPVGNTISRPLQDLPSEMFNSTSLVDILSDTQLELDFDQGIINGDY